MFAGRIRSKTVARDGKPALADIIDRTPAENTEPPSAYCEVHLNDRLVFRTRTKQITPSPYFNAVSERFIYDWRLAKIVLVVRDERNMEHGESYLGRTAVDARSDSRHRMLAPGRGLCGSQPIHQVSTKKVVTLMIGGSLLLADLAGDDSACPCCSSPSMSRCLLKSLVTKLLRYRSGRCPRVFVLLSLCRPPSIPRRIL